MAKTGTWRRGALGTHPPARLGRSRSYDVCVRPEHAGDSKFCGESARTWLGAVPLRPRKPSRAERARSTHGAGSALPP